MKIIVLGGVIFVISIQPIIIIRSLIITILIYSIYLLWRLRRFWFRYMIILVLIRGVLVVFTYIIRVLPNESFEISRLVIMVLGLILIFCYSGFEEFVEERSIGRIKIWGGVTFVLRFFLVIYLLVIIIIIVWVGIIEKGAIRIS